MIQLSVVAQLRADGNQTGATKARFGQRPRHPAHAGTDAESVTDKGYSRGRERPIKEDRNEMARY